ncbi:MerR family transcriptional regulator [uncultured Anaerococcus sp.]|uniref:MerR family transcriptional regulator n=1 Tax=uncultured Anaerococcus sp. TaxID=293428 RepID=UPI00288A88AD|nr:MerR family transcriptional regulator [uncultured Anaerococcus sp.]
MDKCCKTTNRLYSIGEVAKKTKVSTRALRYYEELGLIHPDIVKDNGYRYYSEDTFTTVPIIKYLQYMDFRLEEIKELKEDVDYKDIKNSFTKVLDKTKKQIEDLNDRLTMIKDWYDLAAEAESCMMIEVDCPVVKYLESQDYIKYEKEFDFNYKNSILDVDFASFVKDENNKITGPVMHFFNSYEERLGAEENEEPLEVTYIQKTVSPINKEETIFHQKQGFYASIYHYGCHKNMKKSYEKLIEWAKIKNYKLDKSCIERFVTDYWSFSDERKFVTEILIPILE